MNRTVQSNPPASPPVTGRRVSDDALGALYDEHARPLLAFLLARCRHEAEDVAQEVWLKTARAYPTQFDGKNFRAWLFQIARRTLVDHQRRRSAASAEPELLAEAADPRALNPAHPLLQRERDAALAECLEGLSERERCVFRNVASGANYHEITVACGCDHNGAYKALHAAKAKLRACLETKDV